MTKLELKEWRTSKNMSQLAFGQWLPGKPTPGTISNWENGRQSIPDWLDYVYDVRNGEEA